MKKKLSLILVLVLSLALVLASCGDSGTTPPADTGDESTEASTPDETGDGDGGSDDVPAGDNPSAAIHDSDTLYIGETEHGGIYNPLYYSSTYDGNVVKLVYESLCYDDDEGKVAVNDRIVESYEISEDGLTYTFTLKDGIMFSDGVQLTAEDVVFTYQALSDPGITAYRMDNATRLLGYDEYSNPDNADPEFQGVVAEDELTVSFHFAEKLRTNMNDLTICILGKHTYPDWERGKSDEVIEPTANNPIGSGPYLLEDFIPGQYTSIVYDENYWADADSDFRIPRVVMKYIDTTMEIDEIVTGEVDVVPTVIDKSHVDRILNDEDGKNASSFIDMVQYKRSAYGYIGFRMNGPVAGDKAVRQAIFYAFDNVGFVEAQYGDLANPMSVPMSQASSIYDLIQDQLNQYEYDLDKAAEVLEEGGWVLNDNGLREKDGQVCELTFYATTGNTVVDAMIPVLSDSLSQIGVTLTAEYIEFAVLLETLTQTENDNFDMWFMANGWTTDEPDTWSSFQSDKIPTPNYEHFSNAEFDELINEGRRILDVTSDEAIDIYSRAALILNEELPNIPVYANMLTSMINSRVHDLNIDTFRGWEMALEGAYIQ